MSVSNNFPTIRPSLSLDFANTKTLDPRITFTRSTTATCYDGVTTAKAEENLLTYSQEFGNGVWAKTLTLTSSTETAPDGTSTAYLMTGNQTAYINQPLSSADLTQTYGVSVYAKAGTASVIRLYTYKLSGGTSGYVDFDISAGTASSPAGAFPPSNVSIAAVGSGWYRCSFTVSLVSGTGMGFVVYQQSAGTGLTFSMWGAQVEQRSSVTSYTPTTSQPITNYIPVLQTAAANVARFDHDPVTGESLGLLIEEQRTNLMPQSGNLTGSGWFNNASTKLANAVTSPDGSLDAVKLIPDITSTDIHRIGLVVSVTSGTVYTLTVFAKPAGYSSLRIRNATQSFGGFFDLANGVVGQAEANTTLAISPAGNGWYRCSMTFTASATGAATMTFAPSEALNVASFIGDGYSGVYLWGAQLEAGAFPTSYIPTTSAAVTRTADAAIMTGENFSSWYRADEGTLYGDFLSAYKNNGRVFNIDNGADNQIALRLTTEYACFVRDNNASQAQISMTTSINQNNKVVAAYATNDFAASSNGASAVVDTSGIVPSAVNSASIGSYSIGTASHLCGTIKKIAYYPQRLSNTQLQALTA